MISTSDFKRGSTKILWNNEPWLVVEFQHVKPGKGGAFVRTKLKNLITNRILEETFRSGEKFPEPDLSPVRHCGKSTSRSGTNQSNTLPQAH